MFEAAHTYILGDEPGVLHRKCTAKRTQFWRFSHMHNEENRGKIAFFTRKSRGEGGGASRHPIWGPAAP